MPYPLTIELPIYLCDAGGLVLAQPLGFPDIAVLGNRRSDAIEQARRRVARMASEFVTEELVAGLVRGVPELKQHTTLHQPRNTEASQTRADRVIGWSEPIRVTWDVLHWRVEPAIEIAIVPALRLQVVASPKTDLTKLIDEQILSAVHRSDQWSLERLSRWNLSSDAEIVSVPLEVSIKTPAELAAKDSDTNSKRLPTLRKVATRLRASRLKSITGGQTEIDRVDELIGRSEGSRSGSGRAGSPNADRPPIINRRRDRRSVLLVGPSGVGKTAIFQAWFKEHHEQSVIVDRKPAACFATDGSRMISGESGYGGWQQQCLSMVDELHRTGAIVHLGNAVELCESGKAWGSGGVGGLLATRIADGTIQAVAECTPEQLTRLQRTEPRFIAAMTVVKVNPPNAETTRRVLLDAAVQWRPVDISADLKKQNARKKRRRQRRLDREFSSTKTSQQQPDRKSAKESDTVSPDVIPTVQPEALEWIDRLHRRFPASASSPGRVLNFFDSVMSEIVARDRKSRQRDRHRGGSDQPPVNLDIQRVIGAFSRQTGLPRFLIDSTVPPDLDAITKRLNSEVLGQPGVIDVIVDLIAVMSTDLSRGDRPLASLLMIGPTGVGKTETAKALARLIYSDVSRLVRIDMAEYSDPVAAMRLVGTAAQPDGILTAAVQAQPFSLILLDEFEKADRSVFDLLLQVLGEGRLTDRRGRVADFRNSIIMMTSNLGVEDFRDSPMGLAAGDDRIEKQRTSSDARMESHFRQKVRQFLRPEMANRIDRILTYHPLSQETINSLAERQVEQLRRREGLREHDGKWTVSPAVVAKIAEQGYQPQYGARPLARAVERELLSPLAAIVPKIGRKPSHIEIELAKNNQPDVVDRADQHTPAGRIHVQMTAIKKTNVDTPKFGDPKLGDAIGDDPTEPKTVRSNIQAVSELRRRAQSLASCDALRDARIRWTLLNRKFKRLSAKAKAQKDRELLLYDESSRERERLRQLLSDCRRLVTRIEAFEAEILTKSCLGQLIDMNALDVRLKDLSESLFLMLCELIEPDTHSRDRATLVMSGANLAVAQPLFQAYQRWATANHVDLQVHAIRPRDHKNNTDIQIDAEGWGSEPAFRIATATEENSEALAVADLLQGIDLGVDSETMTYSETQFIRDTQVIRDTQGSSESIHRLAAYRLIKFDKWFSPPEHTLAIMMTFRGDDIAGTISTEAGIHAFHTGKGKSHDHATLLIQASDKMPIHYIAPQWLADAAIKSEFQVNGYPRRRYDIHEKVVQDLAPIEVKLPAFVGQNDLVRKMDRNGNWLDELLQLRREALVWSQLEHDWPETYENDLPW